MSCHFKNTEPRCQDVEVKELHIHEIQRRQDAMIYLSLGLSKNRDRAGVEMGTGVGAYMRRDIQI